MASFHTHISVGIAASAVCVAAVFAFALLPFQFGIYALMALAVTLGAIAPDLDSDSSVPFHLTFSVLASAVAGFVAMMLVSQGSVGYQTVVGYSSAAFLFIWIVIGYFFKRFTKHRGMAHSVPAALLAGLIVFSLASRSWFDEWQSFLLGVSFSFGYLLHLVLDEVYAGVNFHGRLFVPNKAFGSALKFTSDNHLITVFVYAVCGGMVYENFERFSSLVDRLIQAIA